MKNVVIIGAGLSGSLLAIRMAQRGYNVRLIEKRPDLRTEELAAGRSINLALSNRGLKALDLAGLREKALALSLPMRGRMIHDKESNTYLQPYSGRSDDYINSISRPGLNGLLLDEADKYDNLSIMFSSPCKVVDYDNTKAIVVIDGKEEVIEADAIIGTDGAGSSVRRSFFSHSATLQFNYQQIFLSHSYKELSILPDANGEFQIDSESLHIWPRGDFMLIALPNLDKSFTVTLFLSFKGEQSFISLDTPEAVQSFFKTEFPDALAIIPHLSQEFFDNHTGQLGTVKCFPWSQKNTLIMGDAAHAIVPFYGQGMNASFEDVTVIDQLMEDGFSDWEELFSRFGSERKEDADAIADLALDNFYEMRDHVADEVYKKKRQIETQLEDQYEDYYSKYGLVTFREDLSYSLAMKKGRKQDELLMEYCRNNTNIDLAAVKDYLDQNV